MKNYKALVICILVFGLLFSMSACGSSSTDTSGEQTSIEQGSEEQAAVQEATDQQATVTQDMPDADPKLAVDELVGNWIDINSEDRFANITKDATGYQYEDNDGKYSAAFVDGKLKVTVSDTETADVYIDAETGHMILVYQDNLSEFKKK